MSGLYPSIKTASSSRVVKPREQEAMNSWCELLGAGEGYVYPTDELDAVRYAKVGVSTRCALSAERVERRVVVDPGAGPGDSLVLLPARAGCASAHQALYPRNR